MPGAFALINLAGVVADLGDVALRPPGGFDDSLAIFDRFGDRWGAAFARDEFAVVLARQGDGVAARSLLDEALTTWRELRAPSVASPASWPISPTWRAWRVTSWRPARRSARASRFRQSLGDMPGIAAAMEKLAWILVADQPELAARLIGSAEALREAIRAPIPAATRLEHARLAALTAQLGEAASPNASVRAARWPRSRSSRRFQSDGSAGA